MSEEDRLRAWLGFYVELYRYMLPGISRSAEMALKGEPAPDYGHSSRADTTQAQYALGGIDGFLCDIFGSDWHKDIKRDDVVRAMRKHLGL